MEMKPSQIKKIMKEISDLYDALSKAEKLEKFVLREQNWLDNYNGYEPRKIIVHGISVPSLYSEIHKAIKELVNEDIHVDEIVLGIDEYGNFDIFIQYSYDVYNQYGNWVGTEYTVTTLSEIISRLKEKAEKLEKVYEIIQKVRKELNL